MAAFDQQAIIPAVESLTTDSPIVEIGLYRGDTTAAIAECVLATLRPNLVVDIDPFDAYLSPLGSSAH